MKMFPVPARSQKGSALFLILIAVVLFAALSYTMSNIMRGGNPGMITEEKARLYAGDILNYARSLRQAVQGVRISNGCDGMTVSFENSTVSGYEHTPATTESCMIFHDSGGATNYMAPSRDWLDMLANPAPLRGEWYFPANTCAPGTGTAAAGCETDGADNEALIAQLPYVRREVCAQINLMLGIENPGGEPPAMVSAGSMVPAKFTGAQTDATSIEIPGVMAGCFEGAGTPPIGTYHFYQVLLPR